MMLDTRRAQFRGSLVVVALLSAIRLHAAEFVLDEDKVIDVPLNETLEYSSLSGDAYKLTKTGAGKLVFGAISNSSARIVVKEGSLEVRTQVPDKPAVLSSAWLHLDADSLSTMTCNEIDGVSYVAQWRDANGKGISLTGESGVKITWEAYPNTDPKRLPFLVPAFCNGRTVVDLGDLVHKGMQSPQIGRGGAFSFSKQCSTMREAFLVVGDTENAKRSYIDFGMPSDYATPRSAPLLGDNNYAHFIRGSLYYKNGVSNAAFIYSSATLGASKCDWILNGEAVADETSDELPDGLNLVEISAVENSGIRFDALGMERYFYAGGLRYGELVVFDKVLESTDREAVRAYLSARWLPCEIAGLELCDGASLVLDSNVTLKVANFKASGASSVTGEGSLKIVDIDRAGDGAVTFSRNSQIVGQDVSGLLPAMSLPSGGSITVVGNATCAKGGSLSAVDAFSKKGSGLLEIFDMNNGVDLSVEEGAFTIDPLLAANWSYMHFDASLTNSASMTIADFENQKTVTHWFDPRYGTSLYAANSNNDSNHPAPLLKPAFQNGLPVLDFGEYDHDEAGNVENATGRYLNWNTKCHNIRDVFTVASDTDDLDSNYVAITNSSTKNDVQKRRGAPFVGNAFIGKYHFLRYPRPASGIGRPGILLDSVAIYASASVLLDGESVANNTAYPAGFHVLNIKTGADAAGDAFARDRSQIYGGTRIGEFIVFTNEVSSSIRSTLNRGLMSKWLGGAKTIVREFGNVSIAEGATLKLPHQQLAPTGEMNVSGSLEVGTLRISDSVSFASTATFAGNLQLEDSSSITLPSNVVENGAAAFSGGTLKLDGVVEVSFADGLAPVESSEPVKLMSFKSVEGSAEFPLVSLSNRQRVRVYAGDDGLYGIFVKKGLVIKIQ